MWLFAVLLAALLIVTRGISAEAQAAVTPPDSSADSSDPLLGSLSFSSSNQPVEVTARSLEFDYRTRVLIYRGDVVAEGNVHFSKGDRRATAGRAVYDQKKRLIILSRNATLADSRGNISGETVHVYLDDDRTVIDGGPGRVRAVLRPADEGAGREKIVESSPAGDEAP